MILTLTPNPSLDLLFRAERLVWDDANRLDAPRRRPGGQGVNVVRAARSLDPSADVVAVALLGGRIGSELRDMLAAETVPVRAVGVAAETRVFVAVREAGTGRSMLLNPRGPTLGEAAADALLETVAELLATAPGGAWVACCGSIPPGMPLDLYARVGVHARRAGHRFVADCDGAALAAAVDSGCDLLVPNAHEASRLVGRPVGDVQGAAEAARALLGRGPDLVAVTLGEAGAVLATRGGPDGAGGTRLWHAVVRPTAEQAARLAGGSAVGAGDAFLAALLLSLGAGQPPDEGLRRAVAAGTATLLSRGSDLVRGADAAALVDAVRLTELRP